MGTTVGFIGMTKMQVFEHLNGKPWRSEGDRPGTYTVDCPMETRSGVWARLNFKPDDGTPGFSLIHYTKIQRCKDHRGRPAWAEKSMTENSGPNETDCPKALLKIVPIGPEHGEYAKQWRDKIASCSSAKSDTRRKVQSVRVGDILLVDGANPSRFTIVQTTPKIVGKDDTGKVWRLPPRFITRAKWEKDQSTNPAPGETMAA